MSLADHGIHANIFYMVWIINIRYTMEREEELDEIIFSVHNVAAYLVTE